MKPERRRPRCLLRLAVLGLLQFAQVCLGQGGFHFANPSAPIYDAKGTPLAGDSYLADIVVGLTPDSLEPVYEWVSAKPLQPAPFRLSTPGFFVGAGVIAANVQPGIPAWIQVRAWDARLGSTYDEVTALGLGGYGQSKLFQEIGTSTFFSFYPGATLTHLESFSLSPIVPEPTPVLLLLLGLPWLLWRCGRR